MDENTVNLIIGILSPIISALLGWIAVAYNRKTGKEIEAKHRDAFQSALLNGARLALSKQLTGKTAIDLILRAVKDSVPDAIDYFRPNAQVLENLAEAKLQQAKAEATDKLAEVLQRAGVPAIDPSRLR